MYYRLWCWGRGCRQKSIDYGVGGGDAGRRVLIMVLGEEMQTEEYWQTDNQYVLKDVLSSWRRAASEHGFSTLCSVLIITTTK